MSLPDLPPDHRFSQALMLAERELAMGRDAEAAGNDGRLRVCARRAVGAFLLEVGRITGIDFGPHALAVLRSVQDSPSISPDARQAATRLLGGARSILAGEVYSSDPIADAILIINHVLQAVDR